MRAPSIIGIYLLMASAAPALRNNEPETWPSPNGKHAIKETFYGEGKLVRGIFVHTVTGRTAVIYPGGARSLSAIWSPDSHYIALNADRTKYRGEAKLFRIEHGKISEIALPPKMDAAYYLSAAAKARIGHFSFESMRALRWLNANQVEIVSETEYAGEDVSQHFVLEISRGEATIIRTYADNGA